MKDRSSYLVTNLAALSLVLSCPLAVVAAAGQTSSSAAASGSRATSSMPFRGEPERPTNYKSAPKRDPEAIGILGRAVAVLGGASAAARMSVAVADGTATTGETIKPIHWEAKNNQFRMETGTHILASNGHVGWRQNDVGASRLRPHVWASTVVPLRLDGYLSEALTDTLFSVQEAPERSDSTTVALMMRDEHTPLSHALCTHFWYFDRQSSLPVRVDFQERSISSANFFIWTTLTFGGFTRVQGIYGPMQFTYKRPTLPVTVVTLESLQPGVSVDDSRFAIPAGAAQ